MSKVNIDQEVTVPSSPGGHQVNIRADVSRSVGGRDTPPGAEPLPGATSDVSLTFGTWKRPDGAPAAHGYDDTYTRAGGGPAVFVERVGGAREVSAGSRPFETPDGLAARIIQNYGMSGLDSSQLSVGDGLGRSTDGRSNTAPARSTKGTDWLSKNQNPGPIAALKGPAERSSLAPER